MLDETKLKTINDYFSNEENFNTEVEEGYRWPKDPWSEEAQVVEGIFWDEIMSGNYFNVEGKWIMGENGYRVFAGDRDSFGILVAVVAKDGKAFSFG